MLRNPQPKAFSFDGLLDSAITSFDQWRNSSTRALDLGVDEEALGLFIAGAFSVERLKEIESLLIRNKWALDYVINRIKERR